MSLATELLKEIESSPIPISTPDLIAITATGMSNPRSRVWSTLRELERKKLIRKASVSTKCTKWTSVE